MYSGLLFLAREKEGHVILTYCQGIIRCLSPDSREATMNVSKFLLSTVLLLGSNTIISSLAQERFVPDELGVKFKPGTPRVVRNPHASLCLFRSYKRNEGRAVHPQLRRGLPVEPVPISTSLVCRIVCPFSYCNADLRTTGRRKSLRLPVRLPLDRAGITATTPRRHSKTNIRFHSLSARNEPWV